MTDSPYGKVHMSPLEEMIADKLDEVATAKAAHPLAELEVQARRASAPRGFRKAMGGDLNRGYRLIAEIKKATPSKGLIRPDFDPATIARPMRRAGPPAFRCRRTASGFRALARIWWRRARQAGCR